MERPLVPRGGQLAHLALERAVQPLVLGLGAGRKAPSWAEGKKQFVPVTESNLTLSFDHRVLDGGGAGRLLARVAELMQKPATL